MMAAELEARSGVHEPVQALATEFHELGEEVRTALESIEAAKEAQRAELELASDLLGHAVLQGSEEVASLCDAVASGRRSLAELDAAAGRLRAEWAGAQKSWQDRSARMQKDMSASQSVLTLVEILIPKRIADEELGDAQERITAMIHQGRPRWQVYVALAAAAFWAVWHALHEHARTAQKRIKKRKNG